MVDGSLEGRPRVLRQMVLCYVWAILAKKALEMSNALLQDLSVVSWSIALAAWILYKADYSGSLAGEEWDLKEGLACLSQTFDNFRKQEFGCHTINYPQSKLQKRLSWLTHFKLPLFARFTRNQGSCSCTCSWRTIGGTSSWHINTVRHGVL